MCPLQKKFSQPRTEVVKSNEKTDSGNNTPLHQDLNPGLWNTVPMLERYSNDLG